MLRSMFASVLLFFACLAQADDAFTDSVQMVYDHRMATDIVYSRSSGREQKLDVVYRRDRSPAPTLVYIHGGGWVGGNKDRYVFYSLPYVALGFNLVTVGYRLAHVAPAPAAVEDARCALRWVYDNAEEYGFDTDRIVVTGHSAGGHLALMTGMLAADAGLDRRCPPRLEGGGRSDVAVGEAAEMPVAAIVNWYGITDVVDLLDGPNAKRYAVAWLGSMPDRNEIARRVSPMSHLRDDLPPILTIHGDADPAVPYAHATELHEALTELKVPNQLVTIEEGVHGGFSESESHDVMNQIRRFLIRAGVIDD